MVTRKKPSATGQKRKLKVDALKLDKETVKDLSPAQQQQIKGGEKFFRTFVLTCPSPDGLCGQSGDWECMSFKYGQC